MTVELVKEWGGKDRCIEEKGNGGSTSPADQDRKPQVGSQRERMSLRAYGGLSDHRVTVEKLYP